MALLVAGCGAGTTSGNTAVQPQVTSVNPLTTTALQLAVGTANYPGAPAAGGINVVATLRQANGLSGVLVDTPTLSGPFTVPAPATAVAINTNGTSGGTAISSSQFPSNADAGTSTIRGQAQSSAYAAAFLQTNTFGVAGGVFGDGLAPNNLNSLSSLQGFTSANGAPSFAVYAQPLFAATASQLTYRGGPPAWPQVRDGTFPAGFFGYTMGFLSFNIPAATGAYTLAALIPTTSAGTTGSLSASFTLSALTKLGALAPPTFTPDGTGGGTIGNLAQLAATGATEAFAIVVDRSGKCYPGPALATSAVYTVLVTIGSATATLPNNLGPTSGPTGGTHTICTAADSATFNANNATTGGDAYAVYLVGADYPLIENAYPFSKVQKPALTGPNGSTDVTLSAAASGISP